MRGHLIALLALLLGAPTAGATHPATVLAEVDFAVGDLRLEAVRAYEQPLLPGCSTIPVAGQPALPVRVLHFVIPDDASVERVDAIFEEVTIPGAHRVAPAQPEVPIGETAPWVEPDPAIYGGDGPFPAERAVYAGEGYLAGYRIATVEVYPLQYEPGPGTLRMARDLRVEITLKSAASEATPRLRQTRRASRLYQRVVEQVVSNPRDVARLAPGATEEAHDDGTLGFSPRFTPSLEGSTVEYVIITSEELEPYFQELVDWRTKAGITTVVRTVPWIESNYAGGVDTAERVRMFIQDAYESWGTTYVLLGGDTNIIPPRYCFTTYYGSVLVPGDAYYSSVDGDWNDDGDYLFGEGYRGYLDQGDDVDFYPDVFVGRASVNSAVEVETFIDKTLAYEKSPSLVMTDRNLYLAEVLFPYDWQGGGYSLDGAADVVEVSLDSIPGDIHGSRVYSNVAEHPGSYLLSAPAALDSIERGYNLVAHVGHGNKDIMRMNFESYVSMSDASALTNGASKSGFWWLLNCTSAAIDYDCIAERAMNNPHGGASALFGPTRYAFPATCRDYYWDWLGVLYNSSVNAAGAVCATAKARHASFGESGYENTDRWTQFSMVYLGDPALPLWTDRPKTLSVVHPGSIQVGASGMSFTVTDPAAVEGAVVCVYKDGDVHARGETGPTGQVTIPFVPHTTGTLAVTVTAVNHIPRETTVTVTSAPDAHVHVESWAVDDDGAGLSVGNGNGQAEANETVEMDVTVRNTGVGSADAVTAVLTTSDAYVTIQDGTASFGTIAAGAPKTVNEAFRVKVNADCPNDHDAEFTVQFSEAGRLVWSEPIVCRVVRPMLEQIYLHLTEVVGDGDGIPEVGETIALGVDVLNDGNGDAESVTGKLRYGSGHVAVTDSTDAWGDIPAGDIEDGSGGFRFTIAEPLTARFRLLLSDTYGEPWSSWLDLTAPAASDSLGGKVKSTTIELSWEPVASTDLRGYDVYRALQLAGPYQRANDAVIESSSYFADKDLDENTLYHFYVVAVDSSGNAGPHSPILSISTNPPAQPGWPLPTGGGMYASPALADLDGDGDLEIVVTSDEVYAWHGDGMEMLDGDGDPRTAGILAAEGFGGYRSSVVVGEVDGDVGTEVVGAAWGNVGSSQSPVYQVFAWNGEDGSVLPGWPVTTTNFCWGTPALADLDHDGRAEVLIPCANGYLYCWRYNGSEWMDGDSNPLTVGIFRWLGAMWVYGSPAVADIDEDRDLEIIQPAVNGKVYAFNPDGSAVPGWPFNCEDRAMSSPAVGDVDNDGHLEIAVVSNAGKQWLLEANGTVMSGWPRTLYIAGDIPPSPVLANVNADPYLEWVQVSSDGRVNVRNYLGNTLSGWPQLMGSTCGSSPVVADIDGDPGMEIVVGCDNGKVYGFDTSGATMPGWPIQTDAEVFGSAAVGDLDGDGDVEVVVGSMDGNVYVWDCAGVYAGGDGVEWGCFLHDPWRSQCYSFVVPVGVDDGEDGVVQLPGGPVLSQNRPNPFNPVTTIAFDVPDGGSAVPVRLTVHSVDGSLVRTLVAEPLGAGRHSVVWDGRDDRGVRSASGVYFCRLEVGEASQVRKMTLLK